MSKGLYAVAVLLFIFQAWSGDGFAGEIRNRAIVFGGNCETGKPGNQFHKDIIDVTESLSSHGWDVLPLFADKTAHCKIPASSAECQVPLPVPFEVKYKDGCCPKNMDVSQWDVKPIAEAAGKSVSDVGIASKQALLDALDGALRFPKKSQLLLVIDDHGSPGPNGNMHDICLNDGTTLPFNDPDFQNGLKKLKKKGIRLGFTDDSCFSGGGIDSLTPYGCAVSAQSENRTATGDVLAPTIKSLLDTVPSGKRVNLADVYLSALENPAVAQVGNFPQISGYSQYREGSILAARLLGNITETGPVKYWDDIYDEQNQCSLGTSGDLHDLQRQMEILVRSLNRAGDDVAIEELTSVIGDFNAHSASLTALLQKYSDSTPAISLDGVLSDFEPTLRLALQRRFGPWASLEETEEKKHVLPIGNLTSYKWSETPDLSKFSRAEAHIYLQQIKENGAKIPQSESIEQALSEAIYDAYRPSFIQMKQDLPRIAELSSQVNTESSRFTALRNQLKLSFNANRAADYIRIQNEIRHKHLTDVASTRSFQECLDFRLNPR